MVRLRFKPLQSLAVFVLLFSCYQCLEYAEIKEANASCFPKDTCNMPRDVDSLEEHNCDCSSTCSLYRTCCIDSPYLNYSSNLHRRTACRRVGQGSTSVFMVDTCSRSYEGAERIRENCEEDVLDWKDPVANAPVTNRKSQITYKSLYCAICNFEKPRDLVMWQLMLDCSELGEFMHVCTKNRDFVLDNMMFIEEKGQWGLWSWDKKYDWKFRYLPIFYEIPSQLKNLVQHCRPDLISTCLSDWSDYKVKNYCESYMGAVYFPLNAFRNIHCAICNRMRNFTKISCHPIHSPFRSTPLSFGLLLDFDLKDGDTVGSTNGCVKNQVYDPFFKKCRTIECPLPGFKLKDGQCSKE